MALRSRRGEFVAIVKDGLELKVYPIEPADQEAWLAEAREEGAVPSTYDPEDWSVSRLTTGPLPERKGIGYRIETREGGFAFEAFDLRDRSRSRFLLDLREGDLAPKCRGMSDFNLPRLFPHIIREDALIIWDGERWQRVPWLERLDDE
jgi:hypothetical protein